MKKYIALMILALSIGSVNADNLFQSNNPFPQKTPQTMNNIYEAEPVVMQREQKKIKESKIKNHAKAKADKELDNMPKIPVYPATHEGTPSNGEYYLFTTP